MDIKKIKNDFGHSPIEVDKIIPTGADMQRKQSAWRICADEYWLHYILPPLLAFLSTIIVALIPVTPLLCVLANNRSVKNGNS
jgi:hypothetical protein